MARGWPGKLSAVVTAGCLAGGAYGEATLDGTFGHTDSFSGDFTIPHTKGHVAGNNLFHSFATFNIQTGESATFTGPGSITNVISRVTGSGGSFIDGTLSNIPGASFYLLNPNGVLIGENARIDVSGSFHVSTGDYVRFADGARFYADPARGSVLTTAAPQAFGFLDANPARGTIEITGSPYPPLNPDLDFGYGLHEIPDGEMWSFVGGDLRIAGGNTQLAYLFSWAGRVNLVSVASAGEVAITPSGIDLEGVSALGRIDIVEGSGLDVQQIFIRAGTLTIDDSYLASGLFTETGGVIDFGVSGDATIGGAGEFWEAGLLSTTGAEFGGFETGPDIRVEVGGKLTLAGAGSIMTMNREFGGAAAGSIRIEAGSVEIRDGGFVLSRNFADAGAGGDVEIEAGSVRMAGGARTALLPDFALELEAVTGVSAATAGGGDSGGVTIAADTLSVRGGAEVSSRTFGAGRGGDLTLAGGSIRVARDGASDSGGIFVQSLGAQGDGSVMPTGDAGNVTVRATTLAFLDDEAKLSASTDSTGRAGSVRVDASKSVTTAGTNSGIFSSTRGTAGTIGAAPGDAGDVTIRTPLLKMTGPGRIEAATTGDGDAGAVVVEVDRLELVGGAQIRTLSGAVVVETGQLIVGAGSAGTVDVDATRSASLSGVSETGAPSALSSQTRGAGAGGQVRLVTPSLSMSKGALIGADTGGDGNAGGVLVEVDNARLSSGARVSSDSGITVSGLDLVGAGRGGDVILAARDGVTLDGAGTRVSTQTRGQGTGGSVSVVASSLWLTAGAAVGADTSAGGDAGQVVVAAEDLQLSGQGTKVSTATTGSGAGGSVTVAAEAMSLKNGAIIGADTTGGGNAGQVAVIAESLRLGGDGTAISTRSRGTGAGGEVLVAAADLTMMDLARIGADTGGRGDAGAVAVVVDNATLTGGARISSDSGISFGSGFLVGSGAGGTVDLLAAETLSLSGAGTRVSTNTRGAGRGGNVTLQARQLVLRDGASISADSFGTGLAGDVTITLGDRLDIDNASIATRAVVSDGGNIRITAPNFVGLRDSQITTSVQSGVGGGGNVFIDPEFVVLQNSQIIANAFGGPGGNIRIVAGQLIADPYSVISASSALGIDGTVNIDAPDTDVSAGLAVLPESFLDAASLMQAGCGAARAGLSSLVEVGRGGLPPDPDDYLPSLDPGAAAGRGDAAGAGQASLPARFAAGLLAFAPASECLR